MSIYTYKKVKENMKKQIAVLNNNCCSVISDKITEAVAKELSESFSALSDPIRLRLFNLIASSETGEVCACELAEPLAKSQATISHHLKVLYNAGLLKKERRGTWIWYSVVKSKVTALRTALK